MGKARSLPKSGAPERYFTSASLKLFNKNAQHSARQAKHGLSYPFKWLSLSTETYLPIYITNYTLHKWAVWRGKKSLHSNPAKYETTQNISFSSDWRFNCSIYQILRCPFQQTLSQPTPFPILTYGLPPTPLMRFLRNLIGTFLSFHIAISTYNKAIACVNIILQKGLQNPPENFPIFSN